MKNKKISLIFFSLSLVLFFAASNKAADAAGCGMFDAGTCQAGITCPNGWTGLSGGANCSGLTNSCCIQVVQAGGACVAGPYQSQWYNGTCGTGSNTCQGIRGNCASGQTCCYPGATGNSCKGVLLQGTCRTAAGSGGVGCLTTQGENQVSGGPWVDCPTATDVCCVNGTSTTTTTTTNTNTNTNTNTTVGPATTTPVVNFTNPLQFNTVEGLLGAVLTAVQKIIVTLALVFIVIGSVMILTSAGSSGLVEQGKKAITMAMVGLAIGIAAPSILKELSSILGWGGADTLVAPTLTQIALNVLNFLLGITGLLALIMLVIGAIMYLTSAGDEDRIDSGKKIFKYSLLGLILAMASMVLVQQIARFFI